MTEIIGASESHLPEVNRIAGDWASEKIFGHAGGFDRFCSFLVVKGETIIGAVILYNYDEDAGVIEMSLAGDGYWLTRRLMQEVFGTAFDTLGCQMVVSRGSEKNERMLALSRKFDFDRYFIPRLGGRDEGQWLLTMTDDQWRSSRLNKK